MAKSIGWIALLLILSIVLSSQSVSARQDTASPLYRCLDAADIAERFDIHSGVLYKLDYFEFEHDGQKHNLGNLYKEIRDSGFQLGIDENNPRIAPPIKAKAKILEAGLDLYDQWYQSPLVTQRTHTFARGRLNTPVLFNQRGSADPNRPSDSPIPPEVLITAQGDSLYLLSSAGMSKIRIAGDRTFVRVDRNSSRDEGIILKRNGDRVEVLYHGSANSREAYETESTGVDTARGFEPFAKSVGKGVAYVQDHISNDSQTEGVITQAMSGVIAEMGRSFSAQLNEIQKFNPAQREGLKRYFGDQTSPASFAKGLFDRYQTALTTCAKNKGLEASAQSTLKSMQEELNRVFPGAMGISTPITDKEGGATKLGK